MHEQTDPLHLQVDGDRTDLFKTILETAHDAVIALDQNHNIMYFNQGAKRIFGYEDAEVMGKSLEILLPVSMREVYRTMMGGLAESAVTSRTVGERREVSGRRKDGTSFPAESMAGKVLGVLVESADGSLKVRIPHVTWDQGCPTFSITAM